MTDQARRSRRFSVWVAVLVALLAALAAWIVFDPGFRSARVAIATWGMSQDEFDRRVRDYLMEHPEVIIQSVQGLEARQQRADLTAAQDVLAARAEEIFRDPNSPVGGNAQGDVTLVEFFDYNCPYCRKMAPVLIEAEKARSSASCSRSSRFWDQAPNSRPERHSPPNGRDGTRHSIMP